MRYEVVGKILCEDCGVDSPLLNIKRGDLTYTLCQSCLDIRENYSEYKLEHITTVHSEHELRHSLMNSDVVARLDCWREDEYMCFDKKLNDFVDEDGSTILKSYLEANLSEAWEICKIVRETKIVEQEFKLGDKVRFKPFGSAYHDAYITEVVSNPLELVVSIADLKFYFDKHGRRVGENNKDLNLILLEKCYM